MHSLSHPLLLPLCLSSLPFIFPSTTPDCQSWRRRSGIAEVTDVTNMGNSSTKEQRPPPPHINGGQTSHRHGHNLPSSPPLANDPSSSSHILHRATPSSSHNRRGGTRADLSILGIGPAIGRDGPAPEVRKETKQERDARRYEREKVARLKERERSMRDESVDGGYLVTQGVYTGIEDYNKAVVRQLMVRLDWTQRLGRVEEDRLLTQA